MSKSAEWAAEVEQEQMTKEQLIKAGLYSLYYNTSEVADILRMSERNIQKLCRDGKLGSTRTGKSYLIPQESLDEYLKIRR